MRRLSSMLTGLLILFALPASAGEFAFQRIADASTPGMGWTTPIIFGAPAMAQGRVVFKADEVFRFGIYQFQKGSVTVIADSASLIPGRSETYASFRDGPDLSGDAVVFLAYDPQGYPIYTASIAGVLGVIADASTLHPVAGTPISIDYTIPPSLAAGRVVFRALHGAGVGVYAWQAGVLSVVADETDSLPGGGPVDLFLNGRPAPDAAAVVFRGEQSPVFGLYRETGGVIEVVVDQAVVLPFAAGGLAAVEGTPSAKNGTIAFGASSTDGSFGVYTATDGVIRRVIDSTQFVPGTTAAIDYLNLVDHGGPANDGEKVAFTGGNAFGPLGLFVSRGGVVHKVIDTDDTLDGGDLSNLKIGRDSLDGDQVAFTASFADGTQAVYVASFSASVPALPLPALLLLATALFVTGRARLAGR